MNQCLLQISLLCQALVRFQILSDLDALRVGFSQWSEWGEGASRDTVAQERFLCNIFIFFYILIF